MVTQDSSMCNVYKRIWKKLLVGMKRELVVGRWVAGLSFEERFYRSMAKG